MTLQDRINSIINRAILEYKLTFVRISLEMAEHYFRDVQTSKLERRRNALD